jgi:hypothetical protein
MEKTQAGDSRNMSRAFELCKNQLSDLITLTQTPLSAGDRQRVMCMITLGELYSATHNNHPSYGLLTYIQKLTG